MQLYARLSQYLTFSVQICSLTCPHAAPLYILHTTNIQILYHTSETTKQTQLHVNYLKILQIFLA